MFVSLAARSNAQSLVHGHEGHEPDHDGEPEYEVAVRLDEHEAHAFGGVLAEEDLGQQVEQGIAEQTADGEGDHDGERRGVDVRRAEGQQEVGRARDVQRREQGVDRGTTWEEDGEDLG